MLDLNDPRDARVYVGEMVAVGFLHLDDEDFRYISDERALILANLFFAPSGRPVSIQELH